MERRDFSARPPPLDAFYTATPPPFPALSLAGLNGREQKERSAGRFGRDKSSTDPRFQSRARFLTPTPQVSAWCARPQRCCLLCFVCLIFSLSLALREPCGNTRPWLALFCARRRTVCWECLLLVCSSENCWEITAGGKIACFERAPGALRGQSGHFFLLPTLLLKFLERVRCKRLWGGWTKLPENTAGAQSEAPISGSGLGRAAASRPHRNRKPNPTPFSMEKVHEHKSKKHGPKRGTKSDTRKTTLTSSRSATAAAASPQQ